MAAKKKTTPAPAVAAPVTAPAPAAEKKTAAPKKSIAAAPAKKKADAPAPVIAAPSGAEVSEGAPVEPKAEQALRVSRSEFTGWVREAAFQLAQQRQFRNGSPADDWFRAEQILTEQLAAKGVAIVD